MKMIPKEFSTSMLPSYPPLPVYRPCNAQDIRLLLQGLLGQHYSCLYNVQGSCYCRCNSPSQGTANGHTGRVELSARERCPVELEIFPQRKLDEGEGNLPKDGGRESFINAIAQSIATVLLDQDFHCTFIGKRLSPLFGQFHWDSD